MAKDNKKKRDDNIGMSRSQKVWTWIGVCVLVLVLLFWIFDIGTFIGPNQ